MRIQLLSRGPGTLSSSASSIQASSHCSVLLRLSNQTSLVPFHAIPGSMRTVYLQRSATNSRDEWIKLLFDLHFFYFHTVQQYYLAFMSVLSEPVRSDSHLIVCVFYLTVVGKKYTGFSPHLKEIYSVCCRRLFWTTKTVRRCLSNSKHYSHHLWFQTSSQLLCVVVKCSLWCLIRHTLYLFA